MSVAATARPNAAHPTTAPSANRSRARRSGKKTDIRRFRSRDSGQDRNLAPRAITSVNKMRKKEGDDSRLGKKAGSQRFQQSGSVTGSAAGRRIFWHPGIQPEASLCRTIRFRQGIPRHLPRQARASSRNGIKSVHWESEPRGDERLVYFQIGYVRSRRAINLRVPLPWPGTPGKRSSGTACCRDEAMVVPSQGCRRDRRAHRDHRPRGSVRAICAVGGGTRGLGDRFPEKRHSWPEERHSKFLCLAGQAWPGSAPLF